MSRRKWALGLVVACVALAAMYAMAPAQASADDARLTVAPAVYRPGDSNAGASVQLVRHHGYYGGGRGWYGGYRGYGYGYGGWGGYRRGFYGRPYVGVYAGPGYGYGYGYGAPGYGYGYAAPGYGYGYYGGGRCW